MRQSSLHRFIALVSCHVTLSRSAPSAKTLVACTRWKRANYRDDRKRLTTMQCLHWMMPFYWCHRNGHRFPRATFFLIFQFNVSQASVEGPQPPPIRHGAQLRCPAQHACISYCMSAQSAIVLVANRYASLALLECHGLCVEITMFRFDFLDVEHVCIHYSAFASALFLSTQSSNTIPAQAL